MQLTTKTWTKRHEKYESMKLQLSHLIRMESRDRRVDPQR
jgi:hypothetical protein